MDRPGAGFQRPLRQRLRRQRIKFSDKAHKTQGSKPAGKVETPPPATNINTDCARIDPAGTARLGKVLIRANLRNPFLIFRVNPRDSRLYRSDVLWILIRLFSRCARHGWRLTSRGCGCGEKRCMGKPRMGTNGIDFSLIRMIQPIHIEFFYGSGRGPSLKRFCWSERGGKSLAAEFTPPDYALREDLHHVQFFGTQVVMITPEEAINYGKMKSYLTEHQAAMIFNPGKSEWLKSFSPFHPGKGNHDHLLFYAELLDLIAEGVEVGKGEFSRAHA